MYFLLKNGDIPASSVSLSERRYNMIQPMVHYPDFFMMVKACKGALFVGTVPSEVGGSRVATRGVDAAPYFETYHGGVDLVND